VNRLFKALGDEADSSVFAVFSDHGHVSVDPDKYIKLRDAVPAVPRGASMFQTLSARRPNENWLTTSVASAYVDLGDQSPNVIFVPQFAMAQVYVAANKGGEIDTAEWWAPPSLDVLEPTVRSLYNRYVSPFVSDWPRRPVAAILVREPATSGVLGDGRYWAYAPLLADCQVDCSFRQQLVDLNRLVRNGE